MTGEERWRRRSEVIWLGQPDGSVLLLADGAAQPLHIDAPGLVLWESLVEPLTAAEAARAVGVEGVPDTAGEAMRGLLSGLVTIGVCAVESGIARMVRDSTLRP